MKKLFFILLITFLSINPNIAQSLNQGGAVPAEYFSVIPYDKVSDLLFVSAEINNKIYRFLFDTGAPNVISKALQKELNFKVLSKIPVTDSSEKKDTMSLVSADRISIGDIEFENIPTLVTDNELLECFNIDGIIGSNMLRNSIVRISPIDKTITITNSKEKLNLNKENSSKLYLSKQSSPYIVVNLKNKKTRKEIVLFDTGATQLLSVPEKSFKKCEKKGICDVIAEGFGSLTFGIHGKEKEITQYRIKFPSVMINGAEMGNVPARTNQSDHSRIGAPLTNYGIVTLDYINRKFYFEAYKQIVDLEEKMFPFSLSFDDRLIIGTVWDKELDGKINTGDQVLSINGVDYENFTYCDMLVNDFPYEAQEEVTLTAKNREGTINEFILKRK